MSSIRKGEDEGQGDERSTDRLGLTKTFPQSSDGEIGRVPSASASGPVGESGTAPTEPPTERDLVGTRIGSYKVVRELGRGGMGVVYEAVHETLGQRAAVKTLKSDHMQNQVLSQRFLTEAKAITIAQHPGLVKVFDFGQLPDKTLYILMEFLDGESLESRLGRGPIAEDVAVRLCRQVASAIRAAHERGIVHRDLKPSNLYIVPDSEAPAGERVKILDFGLAKILSGPTGGGAGIRTTATGTIMGTPLYMSPEQCRGLSETTGKTDVYALGVILFEMLAGSPPFHADTAGDLLVMHINRPAPRLGKRARTASRGVAALVDDMLKKDPDERPSMAEVEERLQPVSSELAARDRKRRPRTLTSAVVLGLGLVCSVGLFLAVTKLQGPSRSDRHKEEAAAPAAAPQKAEASVRPPAPKPAPWTVTSEPNGAVVLRAADRTPLGLTPFTYEPRAGEDLLAALIEYPGYVSEPITLSRAAPTLERVSLRKLPAVETAPESAGVRNPGRGAVVSTVSKKSAPKAKPQPAASAEVTPPVPAKPEPKKPEPKPEVVDVPPMR